MKRSLKYFWVSVAIVAFFLIIGRIVGLFLDYKTEQEVASEYLWNVDGTARGQESFSFVHHHDTALILVHGYLESPRTLQGLGKDKKINAQLDVYALRLPFHGMSLKESTKLQNQVVLDYLNEQIGEIAKKYKKVILFGYSYGGALLFNLSKENKLPLNSCLILYAPAIYIQSNDFKRNLLLFVYSLWRNYCDYAAIGCQFSKKNTLGYVVMPALKQLYQMDLKNRDYFSHNQKPFTLIVAKDDKRVAFDKQKEACGNNKNCLFHGFDSGGHGLPEGKKKSTLINIILSSPCK